MLNAEKFSCLHKYMQYTNYAIYAIYIYDNNIYYVYTRLCFDFRLIPIYDCINYVSMLYLLCTYYNPIIVFTKH